MRLPGPRTTRETLAAGALAAVLCAGSALAQADPGDGSTGVSDTERAAVATLREAVTVTRDGRHNRMLQALRHRRDPDLRPLFDRLSHAGHPALRLHGLLGLAETADPPGLALPTLVDVQPDGARSELIGAGLDAGLIDDDTALRLMAWPALDPSVKLLLATHLTAVGRFGPDAPGFADVTAALDNPSPGQRGLAALILHQIGDVRGTDALIALNHDPSPGRDAVRAVLLETAAAQGLDAAAPWAYALSTEPNLNPRLATLALQVAMRFGDARAVRDWTTLYTAARPSAADPDPDADDKPDAATPGDVSARTRLALAALAACPGPPADAFTPMLDDPDPFIRQVGHTAAALAADPTPEQAGEAVGGLTALHHPLANGWAMDYAAHDAPPGVAVAVAAAVVHNYEPGEERGRARRLDAVMRAAELLATHDPGRAEAALLHGLNDPARDPLWKQVVLLGLIRSESPEAARLADQVDPPADPDVAALVLILRLNRPDPLTDEQARQLDQLILNAADAGSSANPQGPASLDDALRARVARATLHRAGWTGQRLAETLLP